MREDTQRVGAALRSIAQAIAQGPEDVHYQAAQVVRLGRMLRDNPLVIGAISEVVRHERVDEETLAQQGSSICSRFSEYFRTFAKSLPPNDVLRANSQSPPEILASPIRGSEPATLSRAVIAARDQAVSFAPAEIRRFGPLSQKLLALWEPLQAKTGMFDDANSALTQLRAMSNEAEELEQFEKVVNRLNVGRGVEQLRWYANEWDVLVRNGGSFASFMQRYALEQIKDFVVPLVDLIVAQLDEGIARLHAVHRLRVFFEHFECEHLCTLLEAAERADKERERILQKEMDRFLFHDGFFPVTHAEASRGNFDTFVLGLERAGTYGVPPILIELKQVVSFKSPKQASRAAVKKAINEARVEIARYRVHIQTNPSWSSLVPIIIVVHTCSEGLSDLEASDVVLIDLSPKTPSRKRPGRIIDGAVEAGAGEA